MNEKQQQLTFDKGITNVPSDATCHDGTLQRAEGMIAYDGEHRVIQKPSLFADGFPNGSRLLFVHKFSNVSRYIVISPNEQSTTGYKLEFGFVDNGHYTTTATLMDVQEGTEVTAIGKTLVVNSGKLHYYLWKTTGGASYYYLGSDMPEPWIFFNLRDFRFFESEGTSSSSDHWVEADGDYFVVQAGHETDWDNLIIGLYSKNKKAINTDGCFCLPFFVRYAFRLYDGSYTRVSPPILLFPTVTQNSYWTSPETFYHHYYTAGCELQVDQDRDISEWSDIIKGITIFASRGIEVCDTTKTKRRWYTRSAYNDRAADIYFSDRHNSQFDPLRRANLFDTHDLSAIDSELKNVSSFFKIFELGLTPVHDQLASKLMDAHILENLTSQTRLPEDDYFSRNSLTSNILFTYNSRLILSSVSRGFALPLQYYTSLHTLDNIEGQAPCWTILVRIKTDTGETWVRTTYRSYFSPAYWFYYPDPRADWVKIVRHYHEDDVDNFITYYEEYLETGTVPSAYTGDKIVSIALDSNLNEHQGLHGAYVLVGVGSVMDMTLYRTPTYINLLMDKDIVWNRDGTHEERVPNWSRVLYQTMKLVDNNATEYIPNTIITSSANDPFNFPAKGYFTVGVGEVRAISSNTQALSQGQFGQHPLVVFTDEGVWAASLNDEGWFTSVHPLSRDVILSGCKVLQTDNALFFPTAKGLMRVGVIGNTSSETNVICVSQYINGPSSDPFVTFLGNSVMAYDYRDSLVWIIRKTQQDAYVFSTKSGAFAKFQLGTEQPVADPLRGVINNYPDNLIQRGNNLYSLLYRPDANHDSNTYNTELYSRPMKLENSMALKTITQVEHVTSFPLENGITHQQTLAFTIEASNNLQQWVTLTSLHGKPWKYYRFRYQFGNLKASDTFAGSIVVTQERRTNKLR